MVEFNRKFKVPAPQHGSAFLPCPRRNLDLIFSQRFERTVDRDNTVSFDNLVLQLEPVEWRGTMAGCKVIVNQHLDANHHTHHRNSAPRTLQRARKALDADHQTASQSCGKDARDSHFPTASTTTG